MEGHRSTDKATLGITVSPQEFTSTGRFGTSMSARRILELEQVLRAAVRPLKRYELGSERRETVLSYLSRAQEFARTVPSTRTGMTHRWDTSCTARCMVG